MSSCCRNDSSQMLKPQDSMSNQYFDLPPEVSTGNLQLPAGGGQQVTALASVSTIILQKTSFRLPALTEIVVEAQLRIP